MLASRFRISCLFGVLVVGLFGLPFAAVAQSDEGSVRDAFVNYRSALLAGDGAAAAAHLSQSTYDYYDAMRRFALYGDAKTVQDQPVTDQLQILLLRLRVAPQMLESLSPVGLIAHSIEQGWIGRSSVERIEPGKVVTQGDAAIIHVVVDGEDRGPAFRFHRELGVWRLDLVPVMRATDASIRMAIEREGMGESDFMLAVVERAIGREIGIEAWIPLREPPVPE